MMRLYYRKHNAVAVVHAGLPEGFRQKTLVTACTSKLWEGYPAEGVKRAITREGGGKQEQEEESQEWRCTRKLSSGAEKDQSRTIFDSWVTPRNKGQLPLLSETFHQDPYTRW